ncbi:MAG: phospholipase D-like domain-containing protein [Steroidobacteraceae bacterium]
MQEQSRSGRIGALSGIREPVRFPWRAGNRFELLIDGPAFFTRMLAAITAARRYVFLELYLVESGLIAGRFVTTLAAAARRGVAVHVLLDAFGALRLGPDERQQLRAAGVRLAFYNPLRWSKRLGNLLRDHRKLLLVDGEVAFVGGAGITDEFDPEEQPELRWRETMLAIAGPVVTDWHVLFVRTWTACGLPPPAVAAPDVAARPGGQSGRVVASERLQREQVSRSVIVQVRAAQSRVWIATAYFTPSWKLRRALLAAARRGLDVRLLVPGRRVDHPLIRYAGRRLYSSMLRHGVRIFEYQPRFLHAKVVLVDDWCSIGSSNLDRWNLHWNLEANQEVDDRGFAESVATMLQADFALAEEIVWTRWRRRGRWLRLLERLGGAVDAALRRLRH